MSYFEFEGKKIFYSESGSGRPLLLLHGNTASSKMFEHIVGEYTDDFKVITLDFAGHGRSDRLDEFPADLWFYEAQQVIAFLHEKNYTGVDIIGCSGGAIVAINVALEAPDIIGRVIADSFAGESASEAFTALLLADREKAKANPPARGFYEYMHGFDWEQIVDNDTSAITRHQKEIGSFFHKPLNTLKAEILLTGSQKDRFMYSISDNYYEKAYGEMLEGIPDGRMHLFENGDHPAMLSNFGEFLQLSKEFLL